MRWLPRATLAPAPCAQTGGSPAAKEPIEVAACQILVDGERVDEIAAAHPDPWLVPYGWAAPDYDWPGRAESLHAWIAHASRRVSAPIVGVDLVVGVESVRSLARGPWRGSIPGGQGAMSDASGTLADRVPELRIFEVAVQ